MRFYTEEVSQVLSEVNSNAKGLTSQDAKERLEKNGPNKLIEAKKTPLIIRFFQQMKDPMILILLAAAIVSAVTAIYSGEKEGITDVVIIMVVVLLNAILGVVQESKAEKAIEALQKMSAAHTRVLRDGVVAVVPSVELVVGDVILLEAGDSVPADGRIIENASLKIEEAALTGESVPVNKTLDLLNLSDNKDIPLGDRLNMIYMGSTIVYGRGKAVLTGIGMETEMGKIADALSKAEDGSTPLQIKLNQLSKILSILVVGICVFIFGFSLIRNGSFSTEVVLDTFMIAVSLAVAAIPEGLATVVTIVLSIGVTNMSKRNAIIRRLTAVETLGCAQVICSDKTGTLTQNKMTVVKSTGIENDVAEALALCSDSVLDENHEATGEPTENALVNFAYKLGLSKTILDKEKPRVGEAPFDSGRKLMSTVHKIGDKYVQFTKGAPDEAIKLCTHMMENGKRVELTEARKDTILAENKAMADEALRVLAVATKVYDTIPSDFEPANLERELTYLGLVGMIDPVRPEVIDAIVECRTAGIIPVMITGDHRDTAVAIAKQLGIIEHDAQAITGAQLDEYLDEDFANKVKDLRVFARVQPEHKTRIVNAWRSNGYVTAMTGDGVNDAPSIKSADIGVGMGITGTDVTKNVADMVLADDNFATIVGAVEEGRRIYDNIRKAIQFLLASNMSEVLSIFFATLFGFTILEPIHLLWTNLITDTFPALSLGTEPTEPHIMERHPRRSTAGIFSDGLGFDVVYQGVIVTVLTILSYLIGCYLEEGKWVFVNNQAAVTMAFLCLNLCEIFHSFNMRSQRQSLFSLKKQNKLLLASSLLGIALTTIVVYVPFLSKAFRFVNVTFTYYAISFGLAVSILPIVEIVKAIQRSVNKKTAE